MTRFTGTIVALVAILGASCFFVPDAYRRFVMNKAEALAGDQSVCFFNGFFSSSDVPIAGLIDEGEQWIRPWADFSARFLAAESAKPFHFGMIVLNEEDLPPVVYGWSYRTASFWRDTTGVFHLAYRGDVSADCKASQ